MTCPNCSSPLQDGQRFCPNCGHSTTETLASLSERIAKIDASCSNAKEQKYLEQETVENVMSRVKSWTTLFLYFAGIPLAALALIFGFIFGKGSFDLHDIATDAKTSVGVLVSEARSTASQAVSQANDARTTSQQVSKDVHDTQGLVARLKTETETRLGEAQKLDAQIKDAQRQVGTLTATVNSQAQQVATLTQNLKRAEIQKDVAYVRDAYPQLYGELVASWREGYIDKKLKKPGDIWIAFTISTTNKSNPINDVQFAETMQQLQSNGYRVFVGGVWLVKTTGRSNTGGGANFDESSCSTLGSPQSVPCILYFQPNAKDKLPQLKSLVSHAQVIPDSNIQLAHGLTDLDKMLLEKSAIDYVVVLGAKP